MQDGAPPHITRCVTNVLKHHFTEERVISRQFRHMWPPRSPDLNPFYFWLWGHLKELNRLGFAPWLVMVGVEIGGRNQWDSRRKTSHEWL
ncbi:uncharacterized protein TNCV_655341 [Trichonephila clavipes]|nr:uncharacterized protein TNCV_655341 [Trichonephila clavipes]